MIKPLLNKILPPLCPVCNEVVEDCVCSKYGYLIEEPYCSVCSLPFDSRLKGEWMCGRCIEDAPHFDKVFALFKYDEAVREFIHRIKYRTFLTGVRTVCAILAEKIQWYGLEADFLVPVPLSQDRLVKRGFNQASLIANMLSLYLKLPVVYDVLIRKKLTVPLFQLSKSERKRVLRGAFEVKRRLDGKNVIVVDDIMTTGVTIDECAKMLKKKGAQKVYAGVLARGTL